MQYITNTATILMHFSESVLLLLVGDGCDRASATRLDPRRDGPGRAAAVDGADRQRHRGGGGSLRDTHMFFTGPSLPTLLEHTGGLGPGDGVGGSVPAPTNVR